MSELIESNGLIMVISVNDVDAYMCVSLVSYTTAGHHVDDVLQQCALTAAVTLSF